MALMEAGPVERDDGGASSSSSCTLTGTGEVRELTGGGAGVLARGAGPCVMRAPLDDGGAGTLGRDAGIPTDRVDDGPPSWLAGSTRGEERGGSAVSLGLGLIGGADAGAGIDPPPSVRVDTRFDGGGASLSVAFAASAATIFARASADTGTIFGTVGIV